MLLLYDTWAGFYPRLSLQFPPKPDQTLECLKRSKNDVIYTMGVLHNE